MQNYNKKQKYERKVEEIYDLANTKIRITSFLGKKGSQKRVTQNACNPAVECLHFRREKQAFHFAHYCTPKGIHRLGKCNGKGVLLIFHSQK